MAYTVSFDAAALFRDLNNQVKFAMADALEMLTFNVRNAIASVAGV